MVKSKKIQKQKKPAENGDVFSKQKVIEAFQTREGDTGSPEVQVALLTKRISKLVVHLRENSSDNHSRRGLLGMVSKRRRLLNYLSEKANDRYKALINKLELKK